MYLANALGNTFAKCVLRTRQQSKYNGHSRRQQALEPIETTTTTQEGQAVVPLLLVLDWEIELVVD